MFPSGQFFYDYCDFFVFLPFCILIFKFLDHDWLNLIEIKLL